MNMKKSDLSASQNHLLKTMNIIGKVEDFDPEELLQNHKHARIFIEHVTFYAISFHNLPHKWISAERGP